jgi:outer membrane murein-binding lipoprotein Lpp
VGPGKGKVSFFGIDINSQKLSSTSSTAKINRYSQRAQEYMIWLDRVHKEIKAIREKYLAERLNRKCHR